LVLVWPTPAHAYLDLGTGSMVLQVAVASLMAGLFTLKIYWRKLRERLGLGPSEPPIHRDDDSASEVERGADR
jgi:hypothetical protein